MINDQKQEIVDQDLLNDIEVRTPLGDIKEIVNRIKREDISKTILHPSFQVLLVNILFLSEGVASQLLKPLDNLSSAQKIFGETLPQVLRNQGGDMATVGVTAALALGLFYGSAAAKLKKSETEEPKGSPSLHRAFDTYQRNEKRVAYAAAMIGMLVSFWYASEEYLLMLRPNMTSEQLPFVGVGSRGDPLDILAYSVPLIAGAIFFSHVLTEKSTHGMGSAISSVHARLKGRRDYTQFLR